MVQQKPPTASPRVIVFDNGMWMDIDPSGGLNVFSSTGAKLVTLADSSNNFVIQPGTGNQIIIGGNGNISEKGIFSNYNNVNTAGVGLPPIYAAGAQTLYTNAAPTTLSYTPPATAGVYRISGYLDILTGGTMTVNLKITYKDPGGNARTDIPVLAQQNSATMLAGSPGANVTGRFYMFPHVIAIDNSATAITVADNAGTYTAGTYYWTPILEQLA